MPDGSMFPLAEAEAFLSGSSPDVSREKAVLYVVRGRPGANDRPALPAGHPTTWGAITDGTVLDHAEYPFPVFGE